MTTQTLTTLRQLKLPGMAAALQNQLEQVGTYDNLDFMERFTLLVEQECLNRQQRKQDRLIRQARFKLAATVQDIDEVVRVMEKARDNTRSMGVALSAGSLPETGEPTFELPEDDLYC